MVTELDGKDHLIVSSIIACSVKAVGPQNKKKKNKMEHILQSVKNHETRAVH